MFNGSCPWVDLIKLFGVNLLTLLCKLDHLINISNICSIGMKRSSLQNRVSKFTPKKFYEIESLLVSVCQNWVEQKAGNKAMEKG